MKSVDEWILRHLDVEDDEPSGSFATSQPITEVETVHLPPLSDFAAWAELRGFEVTQ